MIWIEEPLDSPTLTRSASVREPSKPMSNALPDGGLTHPQGTIASDDDSQSTSTKRDKSARHTLQPEYVPPQTHTTRGAPLASTLASAAVSQAKPPSQGKSAS